MTQLIKVGGAVCTAPETLDALALAWEHHSGPGPLVLLHGAGPQLDAALQATTGPPVKVDGLRVTSPRAADVVLETLDAVGAQVTDLLVARGVPAVHVRANQKRLHAVTKDHPAGLGRVGTATHFHAQGLPTRGLLVVTPVGFDARGPLNVNADEAALAVAKALDVREFLLATDVPSVLDADGRPVARLDSAGVLDMIQSGVARGGMVPKLRNALLAVESGVREVVIGSIHATVDGTGTRVRLVHPDIPAASASTAASPTNTESSEITA